MNPDLRNLVALQDLDQKIASLQGQIEAIPVQSENLKGDLERYRTGHQDLMDSLDQLSRDRRTAEGEVELMRSKLSRLKEQLMAVKTNKEYTAMLREIATVETQIRQEEDRILELMEKSEEMEGNISESEKNLGSQTAKLQEDIRRLEDSVRRMKEDAERLQEEKTRMEHNISAEWLDRYQTLREMRKGLALAEANGELCSACHVRIRPQVYANLLQTEEIFACDSCNRILFIRDPVVEDHRAEQP